MVNEHTQKFISVSDKPSTFGVNFHNKGYELLGINAVYIPLQVKEGQLEGLISVIRQNFKGCSVSTPHKMEVMKYLDDLDESAKKVGAVNTVVNDEGRLTGYNTDYFGAKKAVETALDVKDQHVVMFGAGPAARAIGHALYGLGANLTIVNRNADKGLDLAKSLEANFLDRAVGSLRGKLLVNATSVGHYNPEEVVVSDDILSRFDAVFDVVVPKEGVTKLISNAQSLGKQTITGFKMTTYQAAQQFKTYTGQELSQSYLDKYIR